MDISINSGRYAKADSLLRVAQTVDENNEELAHRIAILAYNVEINKAKIKAISRWLDNQDAKTDYMAEKLAKAVGDILPSKYRAAYNTAASKILTDANNISNSNTDRFLADFRKEIADIERKYSELL